MGNYFKQRMFQIISYCLMSEVPKIQFMLTESHRYLYSLFSNRSKDFEYQL